MQFIVSLFYARTVVVNLNFGSEVLLLVSQAVYATAHFILAHTVTADFKCSCEHRFRRISERPTSFLRSFTNQVALRCSRATRKITKGKKYVKSLPTTILPSAFVHMNFILLTRVSILVNDDFSDLDPYTQGLLKVFAENFESQLGVKSDAPGLTKRNPVSDPVKREIQECMQCQNCFKSQFQGAKLHRCSGCKIEYYCVSFKCMLCIFGSSMRQFSTYRPYLLQFN